MSVANGHQPAKGGPNLPSISNASHASTRLSSKKSGNDLLLRASARGPQMQFTPTVKVCKATKKRAAEDAEYRERLQECTEAALTLSLGELRQRYPQEYNSMRGAINRIKGTPYSIDKRLRNLRHWLIHLGPKPHDKDSADRINVYKGYELGNLRWASKHAQSVNRRVTKFHNVPGKARMTTKQLANYLGLRYQTVYKRIRNGWTLERLLGSKPSGVGQWEWPKGFEKQRNLYHARPKNQYDMSPLRWLIHHIHELIHDVACTKKSETDLRVVVQELEQECHALEACEIDQKQHYIDNLAFTLKSTSRLVIPPSIKG